MFERESKDYDYQKIPLASWLSNATVTLKYHHGSVSLKTESVELMHILVYLAQYWEAICC